MANEEKDAGLEFEELAQLIAEQQKDERFCTYYDGTISTDAFESNVGYDPNDQEYQQKIAEQA